MDALPWKVSALAEASWQRPFRTSQRDMNRSHDQRLRAELIGQRDPHQRPTQRPMHNLAQGFVRRAEAHLRPVQGDVACGPGAHPVVGRIGFRLGRVRRPDAYGQGQGKQAGGEGAQDSHRAGYDAAQALRTGAGARGNCMRIGVDLGGTKIEALALDDAGRELLRRRIATPRGDYPGTLAAIRGLVEGLEQELGAPGTVGIGIPGSVRAAGPLAGLVKNANSTWLNGQAFERDISAAMGREVRVTNDANCLAVSEATDGAAAGQRVVFAVILGTSRPRRRSVGGWRCCRPAIASASTSTPGRWTCCCRRTRWRSDAATGSRISPRARRRGRRFIATMSASLVPADVWSRRRCI